MMKFYALPSIVMLSGMMLGCTAERTSTTPFIAPTPVKARNTPPPDYPDAVGCLGLGGTTLLKVVINTEGKVADLSLLRSSGQVLLDQAAQERVQQWQFRPATRNGQPVSATIQVPVRFNPPTLKPDRCFAIQAEAQRMQATGNANPNQ